MALFAGNLAAGIALLVRDEERATHHASWAKIAMCFEHCIVMRRQVAVLSQAFCVLQRVAYGDVEGWQSWAMKCESSLSNRTGFKVSETSLTRKHAIIHHVIMLRVFPGSAHCPHKCNGCYCYLLF